MIFLIVESILEAQEISDKHCHTKHDFSQIGS